MINNSQKSDGDVPGIKRSSLESSVASRYGCCSVPAYSATKRDVHFLNTTHAVLIDTQGGSLTYYLSEVCMTVQTHRHTCLPVLRRHPVRHRVRL